MRPSRVVCARGRTSDAAEKPRPRLGRKGHLYGPTKLPPPPPPHELLKQTVRRIQKAERDERMDITMALTPVKTYMGGFTKPRDLRASNWFPGGTYLKKGKVYERPAVAAYTPHTVFLLESVFPVRGPQGIPTSIVHMLGVCPEKYYIPLLKHMNSATAGREIRENMDNAVWPFVRQVPIKQATWWTSDVELKAMGFGVPQVEKAAVVIEADNEEMDDGKEEEQWKRLEKELERQKAQEAKVASAITHEPGMSKGAKKKAAKRAKELGALAASSTDSPEADQASTSSIAPEDSDSKHVPPHIILSPASSLENPAIDQASFLTSSPTPSNAEAEQVPAAQISASTAPSDTAEIDHASTSPSESSSTLPTEDAINDQVTSVVSSSEVSASPLDPSEGAEEQASSILFSSTITSVEDASSTISSQTTASEFAEAEPQPKREAPPHTTLYELSNVDDVDEAAPVPLSASVEDPEVPESITSSSLEQPEDLDPLASSSSLSFRDESDPVPDIGGASDAAVEPEMSTAEEQQALADWRKVRIDIKKLSPDQIAEYARLRAAGVKLPLLDTGRKVRVMSIPAIIKEEQALQNAFQEREVVNTHLKQVREKYAKYLQRRPFFRPLLAMTFPTRPIADSVLRLSKAHPRGWPFYASISNDDRKTAVSFGSRMREMRLRRMRGLCLDTVKRLLGYRGGFVGLRLSPEDLGRGINGEGLEWEWKGKVRVMLGAWFPRADEEIAIYQAEAGGEGLELMKMDEWGRVVDSSYVQPEEELTPAVLKEMRLRQQESDAADAEELENEYTEATGIIPGYKPPKAGEESAAADEDEDAVGMREEDSEELEDEEDGMDDEADEVVQPKAKAPKASKKSPEEKNAKGAIKLKAKPQPQPVEETSRPVQSPSPPLKKKGGRLKGKHLVNAKRLKHIENMEKAERGEIVRQEPFKLKKAHG